MAQGLTLAASKMALAMSVIDYFLMAGSRGKGRAPAFEGQNIFGDNTPDGVARPF